MNYLSLEISPYLLAHANNPVNWYPWNETALNKAKKENKPIFLSIGYSACHWCHVMENESFMDQQTADFLNEHFISIKVDREERPDLDKIYMDALVSMTGSGGWPMSIFLSPDLTPFYAGTYFPPQPRYGMPSFLELLKSINDAWHEKSNNLKEYGLQIKKHLERTKISQNTEEANYAEIVNKSILNVFSQMDLENGGWGSKPKFPQPLTLLFLLDPYVRLSSNQKIQLTTTLDSMIHGGFYDILHGGFHRYSTDQNWLIPHFEKMLYDNALLSQVYLYAGILFSNASYLQVTHETINFMQTELLSPEGGFWSSLDADSEGEEGLYYIWRYDQLRSLFSDTDWEELQKTFAISSHGNFDGFIILRKKTNLVPLKLIEKLRKAQNKRTRPETDEKILTDWNSLAISVFAKAGQLLQSDNYLKVAQNAATFILEKMIVDGHLYHAYRGGHVRSLAFLSDFAFLINGLADLYIASVNTAWLEKGFDLCDQMVKLFWDGNQFFDSREDDPTLFIRPQTIEDSVIPSGWSSAIFAIQRLNIFRDRKKYENLISHSHQQVLTTIQEAPLSSSFWLKTITKALNADDYITLVKRNGDTKISDLFEKAVLTRKHPETIFLNVGEAEIAQTKIPILKDKKCFNNQSTVFVCYHNTCSAPLTSIDSIISELS
ncbi:MAG: hypothetical protein BGO78_01200 [Chloroflexi bacterium 44-23]|nr:MAG: hypothetical protein BGO78_01200 [Chloroflexi bacterium 44-23]